MVSLDNLLGKTTDFQLGISINDSSDLKFIFESNRIHYIELCIPVVQIKYFNDNLNFFQDAFSLEKDVLIDLVNYEAYFVVNPDKNNKNKKGEIIKKDTYISSLFKPDVVKVDVLTGGEAIKYLINECANETNKRFLNFLIMESLPIYYVIPKYPNSNLLEYYDNIIYRNNRIPKLIELKAPEPIKIFEEKGFQNKINELINLLLSK